MREARRTPCSFAAAVRDVLTTGWADIDREDLGDPAPCRQSARRVHHPHVTWQTRAVHQAPSLPIRVALTRDGRHAVVSDALSGELRIFDVPAGKQRAAILLPSAAPTPHLAPGDSPVPIT